MNTKKNVMAKNNSKRKKKIQTKKKQIKKKSLKEKIMKLLGIKSKSAFTLIELLAVIVILGLLMAIAIPSVTKYITQSRKKTVTSTIGNYIGALVNDVNDLTYTFTGNNTVYAVPIECIALERGGTNPFGHWLHANDAYWAYVLVQYDDETSSYTYGYTFKDSAGYGLYPTSQAKLNEQGKQIQTGLELSRPQTGKVTTITAVANWNGFNVDESTELVVLKAESEGNVGDGETTCTLQQKGDNYASVEQGNNGGEGSNTQNNSFANLIKNDNPLITTLPTFDVSIVSTNENGLYATNKTNSKKPSYYFRGIVDNNVEFAGLKWKIVRINDDNTIRLIYDGFIDESSKGTAFGTGKDSYTNIYYSNGIAKEKVEQWYKEKIINTNYDKYVSPAEFCEAATVSPLASRWTAGNAVMENFATHEPTYECKTDGNGKGLVKNADGSLAKVGLITLDEVRFAGGGSLSNKHYYLYNGSNYVWTMSPAGINSEAEVWRILSGGEIHRIRANSGMHYLQPVINLKADVVATGSGTSSDPYVVQTN